MADVAERDLGTVAEIAERIGARVRGDGALRINAIAAVDEAFEGALTFATDARYLRTALASRATAILCEDVAAGEVNEPTAKALIIVDSARTALASLLHAFEPPRPLGTFIHPSAVIDATATIGPEAQIGPHVWVAAGARIGARATLGAGCVIGSEARIGDDATFHPRSMFLDRCIAGDRLVLQPGAVVGSDGFGYVFAGGRFERIPQVGTVVCGDDVEIGANSCIDRAQTGATRIGDGTKIDNLVQIGHNCRIGRNAAFAAQVGLAGSTKIGDYTRVGGQAGFAGHITIGDRTTIAGNAKVWGNIGDDQFVSGNPAQPHRAELRWQAQLRKVPKLLERMDALERDRA